ncbi:tRNA-2-methylthio-N(6)-dimethylallyladenosine synthase [Dissostichus eleginoides]|uniref:tRNA-2-methylthio-N(6)-dimethylallyladenosine synthase n=1 Tax=Dissostichus eleginoides TaxID=100907 RepID=A0AAD9FAN0_DISEL|nr:tRNA-2-methylthio-N(6)-dimethylallyladenosine synthase [Dissostichus eleginoides]
MGRIKGVQAFSSEAEWGSACHVSIHKGAAGNATVCGRYMMLSFCEGLSPQLLTADPGVTAHNNLSVGGHWRSSLAPD